MLGKLFEAPRTTKRLISITYDILAIAFSLYSAVGMRLGTFEIPLGSREIATYGVTLSVSVLVFIKLGLYRAILRFMAHQVVLSLILGIGISAATLAITSFFFQSFVPRSVPLIYTLTALFFIGTPRLLIRSLVALMGQISSKDKEAVLIYGAGHSGYQLSISLMVSKYLVAGFLDDNPKLHGTTVRGINVFDPEMTRTLTEALNIKHILLALGSAQRSQRSKIIEKLEVLGVSVKTMPALTDILEGKSKIQDIRDVEIEDLLGRDPVKPNPGLLGACIRSKNILVTGAGGSIGSELCRQILKQSPSELVLYDASEYNLYKIEQELKKILIKSPKNIAIHPIVGSVQNKASIKSTLEKFNIDTVYHAAAYKHVPIIEDNIIEGIQNNVFGTLNCVQASIEYEVKSFILISTDKAVRPTNIMGASKRLAELILQALSETQTSTRLTMVRFGNVLGSSGSVVPLFREQLKSGGPVTVTHPEITRYFMTIPEASELVLQAGSMGKGGEVFVLDMGEPVKIDDLAKRIIHLSGLTIRNSDSGDGDIGITYTGLRPGEKLYEELIVGEDTSGTVHPRILKAKESFINWNELEHFLFVIRQECARGDEDKIKSFLTSRKEIAYTEFERSTQEHFEKENPINSRKSSNLRVVR